MGIIWHLYILDEETVMANIVDDGTYGEYGDYAMAWRWTTTLALVPTQLQRWCILIIS